MQVHRNAHDMAILGGWRYCAYIKIAQNDIRSQCRILSGAIFHYLRYDTIIANDIFNYGGHISDIRAALLHCSTARLLFTAICSTFWLANVMLRMAVTNHTCAVN